MDRTSVFETVSVRSIRTGGTIFYFEPYTGTLVE